MNEAYKHYKAIAFDKEAEEALRSIYFGNKTQEDNDSGLITKTDGLHWQMNL